MSWNKIYLPRADIEYLYIKRENGRSIIQLELTDKKTTRLKKYFITLTDCKHRKETKEKSFNNNKFAKNLTTNGKKMT